MLIVAKICVNIYAEIAAFCGLSLAPVPSAAHLLACIHRPSILLHLLLVYLLSRFGIEILKC